MTRIAKTKMRESLIRYVTKCFFTERLVGQKSQALTGYWYELLQYIPSGRSINKGLRTREMSYGTCESAGEKAIGLDQDKR